MSTHGYEEVVSSSTSKQKAGTQIHVSDQSSPQSEKITRRSSRHHEASDALMRENKARAKAVAAEKSPPKTDRVDWFDEKEDGTRWHMWRILIRNSWPGQQKGEGTVYDRGEVMLSGSASSSEENGDEVMEDADDGEEETGTKSNDYGNTIRTHVDTNQVIVRDFGLEQPTNSKSEDVESEVSMQPEESAAVESHRKVQHTALLADFEIFTKSDTEQASQANANQQAQESQDEIIAMNAYMVNGRAVLMPLELTNDDGVVLTDPLALISDDTAMASNGLTLPANSLSSSPVLSVDIGVSGSGNHVTGGSDRSGKENLNVLFAGEVLHDFAQRAMQDDILAADTDASYEMAADTSLTVSAFEPQATQNPMEGAQENTHGHVTLAASHPDIVNTTAEQSQAPGPKTCKQN